MLAVGCFIIGTINSVYMVAYESFYPMLITEGNYSKAYSIASVLETPLSTIHIRKRHMGIEAARLLLSRIQRSGEGMPPRLIELDYRLVVRKSTSANAPEDWIMVDW